MTYWRSVPRHYNIHKLPSPATKSINTHHPQEVAALKKMLLQQSGPAGDDDDSDEEYDSDEEDDSDEEVHCVNSACNFCVSFPHDEATSLLYFTALRCITNSERMVS